MSNSAGRGCLYGLGRLVSSCDFTPSPRSRGLSEHRVFSCEECCISAHMQGWGYQLEEDFGKNAQRWAVTRDSAWRCEHDGWDIAVFQRTLLSIFHSQSRKKSPLRTQKSSLNLSLFVARTIWRRGGVSPLRCKAHR